MDELKQQLDEERSARAALEEKLAEKDSVIEQQRARNKQLSMQMEEMYRNLESEGEGHVNKLVLKILEEKKDKEKLSNDFEAEEESLTNSLLRKLSEARREKEKQEKELEDMKEKIKMMNNEREKLAQQLETEEEALSNSLIRKLRAVTREKEAAEIALSRSSRSSSISEANSSICVEEGGSLVSGGGGSGRDATRDEDARSEMSFMSNLASASESESQYDGSQQKKRILPPPPITVGGVLPVVIGEEE